MFFGEQLILTKTRYGQRDVDGDGLPIVPDRTANIILFHTIIIFFETKKKIVLLLSYTLGEQRSDGECEDARQLYVGITCAVEN